MKNCWTCQFFSLCDVSHKKCKEWTKWDTVFGKQFNLDVFSVNWLKLHKKWYERYDKKLLIERLEAIKQNYEKEERRKADTVNGEN